LLRVVRLPVGPIQANCYLVVDDRSGDALVVDPGDEPGRILDELSAAGLRALAVLVTHGHFDHVGGVAAVATATGAPVYMSRSEAVLLERVNDFLPPSFGPFEPYRPERLLDGGERLSVGPFEIEVLSVPGHSPGHLAFRLGDVLLSGDVLFAGSVGRTDLPGGDWPTLAATLRRLVDELAPETQVLPGHGPETTLAAERDTNPFLAQAGATPS
jgi:glyoxylase-like metal-dependent hydrolase (beta-lactamase superfamily II)